MTRRWRRKITRLDYSLGADHGEEFGECGFLSHGNSLNPAALWVPLLLSIPGGVAAGTRVADPVSLLDLPATILRLTGSGEGRELPGVPLLRAGVGEGQVYEHHSALVAEMEYAPDTPAWFQHAPGPLRAVTLAGWHYIREPDGRERLVDIRESHGGAVVDLNTPGARAIISAGRAVLDSLRPAALVR
jgi:arylsulfatase A-like enzyme